MLFRSELGHETWPQNNNVWESGGAPVWQTPAIDPELGLLIFSTGNPGPDVGGQVRKGDNLFSDSIVAIDVKTGKYKWHFQEVHHDIWDYDAPNPVVLFDVRIGGVLHKGLAQVGKTGWAYILDRETGKPLVGGKHTVLARILDFAEQHKNDEGAVKAFARLEINRMERGIAYLDVIYAAAPLIGLTGTVTGLLQVFSQISPDTGVDLAYVMRVNPALKVLFLNGYYDAATQFYATEYDINHLMLAAPLRANITSKYYESGHMLYLNQQIMPQLHQDIASWYDTATKR